MFRRHQHFAFRNGSRIRKKGQDHRLVYRRQFWVEKLEDRYLLSASSPAATSLSPPAASYDQADTFLLHSDPTATKKIYLDFHGKVVNGTSWNTQYTHGAPIDALAFDLDGNPLNFDGEWDTIQNVWEQVSELFRPFDVDVTTEDPTVANPGALFDSGGADNTWGIRVLIGGNNTDWYVPNGGAASDVNVAQNTFHSLNNEVPAFVFADQLLGDPRALSLAAANAVGTTLGLQQVGQYRYYQNITNNPPTSVTIHDTHYAGHGLSDDTSDFDPIGNQYYSPTTSWNSIMGEINPEVGLTQWSRGEYFNADTSQDELAVITSPQNGFGYRADDHANTFNTTTAADALAVSPDEDFPLQQDELSGKGIIEQNTDKDFFSFTVGDIGQIVDLNIDPFYNGANLDILATIYSSSGTAIATSNPLSDIRAGSDTFTDTFANENPDITPGWKVQLQSDPSGNPVSYTDDNGDVYGLVSLNPTVHGTSTYISKLMLQPGTYYLSVEGTGKPVTYLDGTDEAWLTAQMDPTLANPLPDSSVHPGPVVRAVNNGKTGYFTPNPDPTKPPIFTAVPLSPDNSDYGYSNYGSLGYYQITGTISKNLVVGVDFDVPGGNAPPNWNSFTGTAGPEFTIKNLISEAGVSVPYQLSISTTGTSIDTFASPDPIDNADLPDHAVPLDELGGYIAGQNETTTFTWSNLQPWSYHKVYVFGHAGVDAINDVTITGGVLNGNPQTFSFTQDISADGLIVNNGPPSNADLETFAYTVLSDGSGQITISVTNEPGSEFAVAGLAIAPTMPIGPALNGSISGQKWNDDGGGDPTKADNHIKDPGESGLQGFIVYLDLNNNGELDKITTPDSPDQTLTQASTDIPQAIPDEDIVGVKSALDFTGVGTIEDVNVTLDITHTYDADLHATLISPTGTRVNLFANVGSSGDNFHNTTFDDSALIPITADTAPFTGTYQPQQPLSTFNNESAFGTWKLELIDDAIGDTGVLNSWSITVKLKGQQGTTQYLEPEVATDASGDYSFTNLPPGPYNVREYIQPDQVLAGWQQTWAPPPVTVTSGEDVTDVDFGNWIPTARAGSIQGQVFNDANRDGVKDPGDAGLPGTIVYIDSNNNGVRDIANTPTVIASTDVPKPILDFKTIQSQVTVGSLGSIFNVEVTLDVTHSFVADLDAYLVSPSGTQVHLFGGVGGQYNDFHNLTLSDNAARSITSIGFNDLPYSGTWQPQESLSKVFGEDAKGIWTLVISDTAAFDQGTLNSWSLTFTSGELFRTTDENGNYEFDNLAAGPYTVREELPSGWLQVPPAVTSIPAAIWSNSQWVVTVATTNNDVENVNFGNHTIVDLPGDFNRDGFVDAADYIVWRRTLGSTVTDYLGADGNGNGVVDQADFNVWRANFGRSLAAPITSPGSGSSMLLAPAAGGLSVESSGASLRTAVTEAIAPSSPKVGSTTGGISSALLATSQETVGGSFHDDKQVSQPGVASVAQNDLALLAWLATSAESDRPRADVSLSDDGLSAPRICDEPETVDVAFEMLEGNALASAAI